VGYRPDSTRVEPPRAQPDGKWRIETVSESSFQMAIQWFPGHMHTTRKAIAERLPDIDVVIELLDARLPGSSANTLLAEMTQRQARAEGAQQAGPRRRRAHRAVARPLPAPSRAPTRWAWTRA
jgi:hypothetical protein